MQGKETLSPRRTLKFALLASTLFLTLTGMVWAESPTFSPAIWGDGELWSTQGVALLPAPNGHNVRSFDKLFVVTNSNNPNGQLPISEAAPRNFNYNGGRWFTHTVEWTDSGFAAHGTVPVLKSYEDILLHFDLGHLIITEGSPAGGPPPYFECPLLPVK